MADGSTADVREVTLLLPIGLWSELEQLAEAQNATRGEVIRRSISLMAFVNKVIEDGGKLLVERRNGSRERVYLPDWWGRPRPVQPEIPAGKGG